MRRSGMLLAVSLACAGLAAPTANAGLFSSRADSSIAALLDLVPAQDWNPEMRGFYAVDLAGMREELGLNWPETWPEPQDVDGQRPIMAAASRLTFQPFALTQFRLVGGREDPLAGIGLSALGLDGSIDIGFLDAQVTSAFLVGENLVDVAAVSAALGAPPSSVEGLNVWPDSNQSDSPLLRDWRLVTDGSDMAIIQNVEQDIAALAGSGATLRDQPAVAALLAAVDGPDREAGTLVALWAAHPDSLNRLPGYPEGGWGADAALPPYDLFAASLRYEAGMAVESMVLVYQDMAAAERAEIEMARRVPEIADRFLADDVHTAIVAGADGWCAVVVESRNPISDELRAQPGVFHGATRQFVYLDFGLILP